MPRLKSREEQLLKLIVQQKHYKGIYPHVKPLAKPIVRQQLKKLDKQIQLFTSK